MPWVDKEKCTGCQACIQVCPVGAIEIKEEKAQINMDECIRCGKCHDACPQNAVRHDSERIPIEVEENIKRTKGLMKNFESIQEKQEFLGRMIKHFNKERIVAEKSIEETKKLKEGSLRS